MSSPIHEYVLTNLDINTTEAEIEYFFKDFDILSSRFYFEVFNNKKIRLPYAIIRSKSSNLVSLCEKNIIQIRGRFIMIYDLDFYCQTRALLFVNSVLITCKDIEKAFRLYNMLESDNLLANYDSVFVITFLNQDLRNSAIKSKFCTKIKNSLCYLRPFSQQTIGTISVSPLRYTSLDIINASESILFHFNQNFHEIPKFSAIALSKYIRKFLAENQKENIIFFEEIPGKIELIIDIFNLKDVFIEDNDVVFVFQTSMILEIESIIDQLEDRYYLNLNAEKFIRGLELAINYRTALDIHIRYAKYHHEQLKHNQQYMKLYPNIEKLFSLDPLSISNTNEDLNQKRESLLKMIQNGKRTMK